MLAGSLYDALGHHGHLTSSSAPGAPRPSSPCRRGRSLSPSGFPRSSAAHPTPARRPLSRLRPQRLHPPRRCACWSRSPSPGLTARRSQELECPLLSLLHVVLSPFGCPPGHPVRNPRSSPSSLFSLVISRLPRGLHTLHAAFLLCFLQSLVLIFDNFS